MVARVVTVAGRIILGTGAGAALVCRDILATPSGQAAATAALVSLLGSELLYAILNAVCSALWLALPLGLPVAKLTLDRLHAQDASRQDDGGDDGTQARLVPWPLDVLGERCPMGLGRLHRWWTSSVDKQ